MNLGPLLGSRWFHESLSKDWSMCVRAVLGPKGSQDTVQSTRIVVVGSRVVAEVRKNVDRLQRG